MSKHNINGTFDSRAKIKRWTREEMMAHYDSLPKEYRDVIKDTFAPTTIEFEGGIKREPEFYKRYFEQVQRASTRKTYGADHPQAA